MKNAEIIKIYIPNWEKYNPRKDIKRMSFFRLEADIFEDEKFFSLRHIDKVLLLYIYTRCCKQTSTKDAVSTPQAYGKVSLNIRQASAMTSIRVDHIRASISRLEQNQLLTTKLVTDTCPRIDKNRIEETRIDKKNIKKKKEPAFRLSTFEEVIKNVTEETLKKWSARYPDHIWMKQEIEDALEWHSVKRDPTTSGGWSLFISNWLKNAKPPKTQNTPKTFEDIKAEKSMDAYHEYLSEI